MMENMGCKGTQAHADCNTRLWNGEGSCTRGGYACIACTEPGFQDPGHPFHQTPKLAGIPIGLPTDMPKAWFVALASLIQERHARRVKNNAVADHVVVKPAIRKTRNDERWNATGRPPAPSTASKATWRCRHGRRPRRRRTGPAPMYRGFEQMLQGRAPHDALVIVPRICGICSVSQSVAAALGAGRRRA